MLVQPRKTSPCLTDRLLMERKESNKKKNMSKELRVKIGLNMNLQ